MISLVPAAGAEGGRRYRSDETSSCRDGSGSINPIRWSRAAGRLDGTYGDPEGDPERDLEKIEKETKLLVRTHFDVTCDRPGYRNTLRHLQFEL